MTTESLNPDTLGRRLFSFGVITDTHVNQGLQFPFCGQPPGQPAHAPRDPRTLSCLSFGEYAVDLAGHVTLQAAMISRLDSPSRVLRAT